MRVRTKRIQEIYWEHFSTAGQRDLEDWLFSCIGAWVATGKVTSFSPFGDFFPSVEPEEMSFAAVGAEFPEEKMPGCQYSPAVLFRRALGNVVAREGLYQDAIEAWRFALGTAEYLRLSELAEVLSGLVGYGPFRDAGRDEGHSLFRDAFEAVDRFGPDMCSREFWKACLPWVYEYPALSLRLLQNLVQCEPSRWSEFATDSRMVEALISHRLNQMRALNTLKLMEFDLAALEISKCVSDAEYSAQWSRLRLPGVDFLVDRSRLLQIGKYVDPGEKGRGLDASDTSAAAPSDVEGRKTRNLRKRAGEVNNLRPLGMVA